MNVFDAMGAKYLQEDDHWGSDLDILEGAVSCFSEGKWLDLGCGPGYHISRLLKKYPGYSAIGLDSSKVMLAEARRNVSASFVHADMVADPIGSGYHVVTILNNTLGNVVGKREEILEKIYNSLVPKGYFICSVYNKELLDFESYGSNLEVDKKSDVSKGDLVVMYKDIPYYSHWFTCKEIVDLVKGSGFSVETVEKREKRIIVVGRK